MRNHFAVRVANRPGAWREYCLWISVVSTTNRLPALESAFVGLESDDVPFVFASILDFDRPIALDALRTHVDAAFAAVPRYRQGLDRAKRAWVAAEFHIERHVHATSVPAPGGRDELEALAARLLATGVPPDRPPWQLWTVGGLAGGRGALIALVHHTLVDGIAGFRLLEYVLSTGPVEPPPPDVAPDKLGALRRLVAWKNVRALARLLRDGLNPASQVGLNPRHTGRRRAVASHTIALDDVKSIQHVFDATNNDVVLAVVALALRRILKRRGVDPDHLRDVRAMVPVGRHAKGEHAASGNRVALMLAKLPVDDADPAECVRRVAATTREIKAARTVGGGDLLVALGDATTPGVLLNVLRVALWMRAFNVLVTNVPGPTTSLSLLGARLARIVPIVNLWPHQSLGIAVASYAGTMTFGFQVDQAVIADAGQVRDDFAAAFESLLDAARHARAA
jgi:hypothetical protein